MKFIINKDIVLEKLLQISGPTTSKQNYLILNSVFITSENNKLKLITTDLDTTIIAFLDANIEQEGRIAVPMSRLLSILRELPSSDLIVKLENNNLLINCEKIEFKINTVDAEQFPKIEDKKKTSLIKINPLDLEEMIRLTSFSVSYEDVNYVLNGISIEIIEDKISFVSTDGKRMSFITKKLPYNQPELKTKLSFILPIKAINELYKIIKERKDDVFIFVDDNKVGFDFKDTQFIARPIQGEFPSFSQYIPQESKNKLAINRKNFLLALRRASLLSTPEFQGVKLDLKKECIVVSKKTPQLGEVTEVVDALYKGQAYSIGVNPNYLMDVLKNIDEEEIIFEFSGVDKPVVFRKEGYICLVLPMSINEGDLAGE